MDAWSSVRSSLVCKLQVDLIDDYGRVDIWSSQDVTDHENTAASDDADDVWLVGFPAELLIRHKIRPVYPLDGPGTRETRRHER